MNGAYALAIAAAAASAGSSPASIASCAASAAAALAFSDISASGVTYASSAAATASGEGPSSCAAAGRPGSAISVTMAQTAISFFSKVMMSLIFLVIRAGSERIVAGLAGAHAHGLLDVEHEDLPVADLAGLGRRGDHVDHLVDLIVLHDHLQLDLGHEIHDVLGAAIDLGMAGLPPVALDLRDHQTMHARRGERLAHLLELEGLDDGDDQFHHVPRYSRVLTTGAIA